VRVAAGTMGKKRRQCRGSNQEVERRGMREKEKAPAFPSGGAGG
jgi:hypothetical protein